AELPTATVSDADQQLLDQWANFMSFRSEVYRALEQARADKLIGKSLEAAVVVYPKDDLIPMLTDLEPELAELLIVSKFQLSETEVPATATKFADFAIEVSHAPGAVCERCRKTLTSVGTDPDLPTLCADCAKIVR